MVQNLVPEWSPQGGEVAAQMETVEEVEGEEVEGEEASEVW